MTKTAVIPFLAMLVILSGCGIKPADVDPPQGKQNDHFPQTYPRGAEAK